MMFARCAGAGIIRVVRTADQSLPALQTLGVMGCALQYPATSALDELSVGFCCCFSLILLSCRRSQTSCHKHACSALLDDANSPWLLNTAGERLQDGQGVAAYRGAADAGVRSGGRDAASRHRADLLRVSRAVQALGTSVIWACIGL